MRLNPRVSTLSIRMALGLLLAAVAACAHKPVADRADGHQVDLLADSFLAHAVVLLGEVHDNPDGHHLRTEALARAIQAGWRPIIAMEQFDRERQRDLDKAMQSCSDAACVINLASSDKSGWNWDFYQPIIELALQYRLPLIAANLSRGDARRVMAEGMATVFPPAVLQEMRILGRLPPDLLERQIHEVVQGHCGMLPTSMHQGMATAQIARDAMMAWQIRQALADTSSAGQGSGKTMRPLVLLAGNGHVRKDQGVPRWLNQRDLLTVGFTEAPAAQAEYDENIVVRPAQRPDPCNALRSMSQGELLGAIAIAAID
jgi:uncharacterized iron-regulated protein